jgi:hypothetical protein
MSSFLTNDGQDTEMPEELVVVVGMNFPETAFLVCHPILLPLYRT